MRIGLKWIGDSQERPLPYAELYSGNTTGSTLLMRKNPISIAMGISTPMPTNTGA